MHKNLENAHKDRSFFGREIISLSFKIIGLIRPLKAYVVIYGNLVPILLPNHTFPLSTKETNKV